MPAGPWSSFIETVPVAKIVPVGTEAGPEGDEARIALLERHGLARRGTGGMRQWLKTHRPIKVVGRGLAQGLIEERRGGW